MRQWVVAGLGARLPFERTSFIGRERELSAARDLLRCSRLLTLTGVGGSGKTRLALELASEIEDDFAAGAVLVELAPLNEGLRIPQAIAQALGLAESAMRTSEESILAVLGEADTLLVLDNCEHLAAECATLIDRLLKSCGSLRVLATSRQPLEVAGETVYAVPPLSTPASVDVDPGEAMRSEAVRLFVDRAALARPGFGIVADNASAVTGICRRLDGLPLAIELAAARMRSMSAQELLAHLSDRFGLLTSGGASEPRHRTLRATIDWSHALLGEAERVLFRRLSVFAGGWLLEDAEIVCADALLPRERIVSVHSQLVDRSLILAEPGFAGPTRHRLLETIREYAMERLAQAEESEAMRSRHFAHFLATAEEYYRRRMSGGSDVGLAALAEHRDNFRTALAWAAPGDAEGALRMTSALEDVWRMVGAAEGWEWLEQTLPGVAITSPYRGRALLTAGMLSAYLPAYDRGARLLTEASEIARRDGDRVAEAWAMLWLGRIAFFSEDVAGAERHLQAALALHRSVGNVLGQVRALALLGLVRGLSQRRVLEALGALDEAIALADRADDGWGRGYAHLMLGLVQTEDGRPDDAAPHFRIALRTSTLGPILGVALQGLARCLVDDDARRALRLLGAAAAHFDRTGTLQPSFVSSRGQAGYERGVQMLGRAAAARAFDEGRRMSLGTASSIALTHEAAAALAASGGLTRRERQVATLVTRGLANRDIASTLFISVRTVESHVDRALAKLGLHNRTQLAAWAHDHLPESIPGIP